MKLHKLFYKWFAAMWFKGKPVIDYMIMRKGILFYVEMKVTDKCIFKDGWL